MYEEAEMGNRHAEAVRRNPRPVILPEPYTGEGDYTQWQGHFESVAAVNGWDDVVKFLWLRVQLTGRAQTALKRLPEATKVSYEAIVATLAQHFEHSSERKL